MEDEKWKQRSYYGPLTEGHTKGEGEGRGIHEKDIPNAETLAYTKGEKRSKSVEFVLA